MTTVYYGNQKKKNDELAHHGIKGQKWGVRRFQNADGTRTAAGRKREKSSSSEPTKKKGLSDKQKTALKVGAALVGTALVAYGGFKLAEYTSVHKEATKMIMAEAIKKAERDLDNDNRLRKSIGLEEYTESEAAKRLKEFTNKNKARVKPEIKNLTNETMKYKTTYRIGKIKDVINPNPFGSYNEFLSNPMERYKKFHSELNK